jgi:ketosteroid isomerase-like protein
MKTLLAFVCLSAAFAAPLAHAQDAAVEAPIHQFIDGVSKGDMASVKAAHVASPVIVDNIAPHIWTGPEAFDTFIATLVATEAAAGKTGSVLAIGDVVTETVSGDSAYVVVPSTYTYRQNGRTMRETGTITFVLVKQDAVWKIASWVWTSPDAVPVS